MANFKKQEKYVPEKCGRCGQTETYLLPVDRGTVDILKAIMKIKYLSLFSGIGGFELGIQQAYENKIHQKRQVSKQQNIQRKRNSSNNSKQRKKDRSEQPTCIGYSEVDKYAIQIYKKHFNHKNYGDITKINIQELPDFDLIVGGFPCQSFSIAGKRGGFEDTRGTLFFEIAKIARIKRPRLLLLENVKGLLSHDEGATFATIISTLDELGYDCQWQVLNSKNFGVPQNRERVFIIGHLRGTSRPKVFPIENLSEKAIKVSKKRSSVRTEGISGALVCSYYKIPSDGQYIKIKEATKKGYAEAKVGGSINLSVPNSKTRRGGVGKGIAQTIDAGMQQHTLDKNAKIRRLTPMECERLQGFPDGWTSKGINEKGEEVVMSDTQRYKTCGNAVTTNVIKTIVERLL